MDPLVVKMLLYMDFLQSRPSTLQRHSKRGPPKALSALGIVRGKIFWNIRVGKCDIFMQYYIGRKRQE